MKSRIISVIGMALFGVVANGCSAETGPQGSGEPNVTESSSALVVANAPAVRMGAASCVVRDTDGIDKVLVFGGESSAGTATNTLYLYDPLADSWTTKTSVLGAGSMPNRSRAKMVNIRGTDQCLLAGGSTDGSVGNAKKDAYIYDLSANTWTQTSTNMAKERIDFEMSVCGSGTGASASVAVFGGTGPSGDGNIEVYNVGAGAVGTGTWAATALNTPRSKLAVAAKDTANADKFLIAGGDAGGTFKNTVELVSFTNNCGTVGVKLGHNTTAALKVLQSARFGLVAFPEGSTDVFIAAGGNKGGMTPIVGDTDVISVLNWTAATDNVSIAAGTSLTTPRESPKAVLYNPSPAGRYSIVGGLTAATTGSAKVQTYNPSANAWLTEVSLNTARYDFITEYLASEGRVLVSGGSTSGSALSSSETF